MEWKRQTPEKEKGDYWFAGQCFVTAGVNTEIPPAEIQAIVQDVYTLAAKSGGIDYLQCYQHSKTKRKIWVIDQVTKTALTDGSHPPEHNYFTVLFPEEY